MRKRAIAVVALLALLTLVGCEQDDGATVTELEDDSTGSGSGSASASGSASGSGSASASGSASGSASASATVAAACEPVGDAESADSSVEVVLDEWRVDLSDEVSAGTVTFEVENVGEEPHELVIVQAADIESLPVTDGKVDEEGLGEGEFIGEVEAFPAGESCEGTFALEPGDYVFFCNLVEEEEGVRESHFEEGMRTEVTVG